jgi:3-hydroxyacyl-CoA dehydrogenase
MFNSLLGAGVMGSAVASVLAVAASALPPSTDALTH